MSSVGHKSSRCKWVVMMRMTIPIVRTLLPVFLYLVVAKGITQWGSRSYAMDLLNPSSPGQLLKETVSFTSNHSSGLCCAWPASHGCMCDSPWQGFIPVPQLRLLLTAPSLLLCSWDHRSITTAITLITMWLPGPLRAYKSFPLYLCS